jgi:lipopolysaccharide exporter
MTAALARRAGSALAWKAFQLAAVRGVLIIRTFVLARLLSPDDFGLLAIAVVAVGVLMSLSDIGMGPALVHHPDIDRAHYDSAWTIGILRALAVTAVLIVAAPAIATLFAEPRAVNVLRVLALKPLIDAGSSIKTAELMRALAYRRLAIVAFVTATVETVVSIVLAFRFGVWALVLGALAGAAAGLAASYIAAPYRPRLVLVGNAVRPLVRYGRWLFLTGVVAMTASSLTQIVISRRLGAVELGLYFLAMKLAFFPYEFAGQVIKDVAFPMYARIQGEHARVSKAFRAIFVGLATFLLPSYVLLIALAPWLVHDVLGARWTGTEPLIQILALAGVVGLFGDTCGPLFQGLGRTRWILAVEFFQSGVVLALVWMLTTQHGVFGASLAWLIAICSSQLLNLFLARRLVDRPLANAAVPVGAIAFASIVGAAVITGAHAVMSGINGLIGAAALGASVTALIIWVCDVRFRLDIGRVLAETFPQLTELVGVARGR